jgi:hypothetical protein
MAEQANRAPEEECFLFEDRVHTNATVDHRIDDAVAASSPSVFVRELTSVC